ncbi:MAG: hypothetical protein EXR72_18705 [Myxococcales bacterium]|nr:hypothetical protein [Myxococcales bacterium]
MLRRCLLAGLLCAGTLSGCVHDAGDGGVTADAAEIADAPWPDDLAATPDRASGPVVDALLRDAAPAPADAKLPPDLAVPDLAVKLDLMPAADLTVPPDQALRVDLAMIPADLRTAPDLGMVPLDLAMAVPDLGMSPPDLAMPPPDLEMPPPDLEMPPPDLAKSPDLQKPADLAPPPDLAKPTPMQFTAIGDIPYVVGEEPILEKYVTTLDPLSPFLVHLGDIKSSATACDEKVYQNVAGILAKSPRPVFIVIGDNEWNDCADAAAGWALWNKYFLRFEQKWNPPFPVDHQMPEQQENFAFVHSGVLFIGISIVAIKAPLLWDFDKVHANDLAWTIANLTKYKAQVKAAVILGQADPETIHDAYFKNLKQPATTFGYPILYLHGDGHSFYCKKNFQGVPGMWNVQVDSAGKVAQNPVKVTVTKDPANPFLLDRNGTVVGIQQCQ